MSEYVTAFVVEPVKSSPARARDTDDLFDKSGGIVWADVKWAQPWELAAGSPIIVERDEVDPFKVATELFGQKPTSMSYGIDYYLEHDPSQATATCRFADGSTRELSKADVDRRVETVAHDAIVYRRRYLGTIEDAWLLSDLLPTDPVGKDGLVRLMHALCFDEESDDPVASGKELPPTWGDDCDEFVGNPKALAGLARIWFRMGPDDRVVLQAD